MRIRSSFFVLLLLATLNAAGFAQEPGQKPGDPVAPFATDPTLNARLNLPVPKNPALPTLFLVGDSTVRNGKGDGANNQMGWGEPLVAYFDPAKVNVVNRAIGGRSSRTYITEGHWKDVLDMMKPGDVVLFQFGHNDSGPLDDTARARGTINGVGDESKEIENPILKRHETVHTYGWYMAQYVSDTLAKGATPVICSLIPRKTWRDGKIVRSGSDSYGGWARQVAEAKHIQFVDLNSIIADRYDAMGEAAVEPLFGDPHTHTSLAGAQLNAEAVVSGLKALPKDPVAKDFSAMGAAVKPYVAAGQEAPPPGKGIQILKGVSPHRVTRAGDSCNFSGTRQALRLKSHGISAIPKTTG